jgi:ubiquinone/menaquinone biosynthesis C-methylase UbiE
MFLMTSSAHQFGSTLPADKTSEGNRFEVSGDIQTASAEQRLREEFDRWARDGRGQSLESEHLSITEKALGFMDLRPGLRVLDLSCGSGWATCLLARRVAGTRDNGHVVGVDISKEMLNLARQSSDSIGNIEYVQASAESLPLEANLFDRILSVEAFYYYPDQGRALDEMYRVLTPGGQMFILINIYRDKPSWKYWATHLAVKAHFLSEAEYVELITAHGFTAVHATRIPDEWRPRGGYIGAAARTFRLFLSPPQTWLPKLFSRLQSARLAHDRSRNGALLLIGTKPHSSAR